jgi:hypothetical protein
MKQGWGRLTTIAAMTLALAGGRCAAQAIQNNQSQNAANQGTGTSSNTQGLDQKEKEDLGNIQPASTAGFASYFHGQASLNMQYTSNAPLYHTHDDADFIIIPSVEEGVVAPLNEQFKFDAAVRLEDFTYVSHQSLGFWGFSSNADLEYRYKPNWPRIYVGTEPYYYFSYDTGGRLTSAIGPVAGMDQSYSINRGKTLLLLAYHFGQYYSEPSLDTRQSHTFTIALTQQIKPDLYGQVYYQWQYSKYSIFGRDEDRNVVGVSLIHQLSPTSFLSAFFNFVDNASNNSLAKYTTLNSGLSLVYQY